MARAHDYRGSRRRSVFPDRQAALALTVEGEKLRVALKTLTPNFKRFAVRFDEKGEWQVSDDRFAWELGEGRHRVEAKTMNQFGVARPASSAVVVVAR